VNKLIPPTALFSIIENVLKANENLPGSDSSLLLKSEVQQHVVKLTICKDHVSPDHEERFRKMLEASVMRTELLHQGGVAMRFKKGTDCFNEGIEISINTINSDINQSITSAAKPEVWTKIT
jgi:hypothetical protein